MVHITDEKRVTAKATMRRARTFYSACIALNSGEETGSFIPVEYYLLCHSFELALKAFLRDKGFSVKDLRKLGHNLVEILSEVQGLQIFSFTNNDEFIIRQINVLYNAKELEYSMSGIRSIPMIKDLKELVFKVIDSDGADAIAHDKRKNKNS